MFLMYFILFAAAIHNTIRFIFLNRRFKNFHIIYFYVLVYMVIFLRIAWLSLIIRVVNEYSDSWKEEWEHNLDKSIFEVDIIATYIELLIGVQ